MGSPVTVELRRLDQADLDALVEIESANQTRPWTRGVFADEISGDDRIYLGLFAGKALFGFAGALVVADEAHVTNLFVAPDQRRKGYARRLLVALIEICLEMGARHLTLEVRSRNVAAIDLYRRFGLGPVGVRKEYYGNDDALILWANDIDSADYRRRLEGLR